MLDTLGIDYRILLVDDDPSSIGITRNILEEFYEVSVALDGVSALDMLADNRPDLILLDVVMPGMDGYEVCGIIKANPKFRNIPIIFLTGRSVLSDEEKGFFVGAADYVIKPINPVTMLARIRAHLRLADQRKLLEHNVKQRTAEISDLNAEIIATQKEVLNRMGSICEGRSKETANHVKRVAEYSKILANLYGLSKEESELLRSASPMHDIGKVAIGDHILNKPGALSDTEYRIMQTHADLGFDMLSGSERNLLKTAATVALEHHEKWDGTGYPRRLKGEDISIYGRITSLADVFDALGHDRCYKQAWPDEQIFELFREQRGKHFDPKLVDLFFENVDKFIQIRKSLPN